MESVLIIFILYFLPCSSSTPAHLDFLPLVTASASTVMTLSWQYSELSNCCLQENE